MSRATKQLLGAAFAVAVVGGVLAFAIEDENVGALNLSALGGVLLGAGTVLAAGAAIAAVGPGKDGQIRTDNLRAITGLVAVVAGVAAVAALTIVAVTLLAGEEKNESIVAITSSAFGIVSAVVSAFLGIKVTAESSAKAHEAGKEATEDAAIAKHEAKVKEKKISVVNDTLDKLVEEKKVSEDAVERVQEESIKVEEEARKAGPSMGGGSQ
jgi:hypothetical protein